MHLVLAAAAALAFTLGGVCMKYADGLRQALPALGFIGLFATGAVLQSYALRDTALGTTYILVLGLEAVLACGFGFVFFAETFTAIKIVAVLLVLGGIALLRAT
jgi:multidrug transporter EmrE-like cation transporter